MMFEHGIPEESIDLLANAVDLARFQRRAPLPSSPRRALVVNNGAVETGHVAILRSACARRNIHLDILGELSGNATWNPENILPQYDLVFARARCALEAAAVGTAVILCDEHAMGGMVTTASLDAMRALNFGFRTLQTAVTEELVGAEIDRYDAADASAVSDRIRASAPIDALADQYIAIYRRLAGTTLRLAPQDELVELGRILAAVTRRMPIRTPIPRRRLALMNSRLLVSPLRALRWLKRKLEL
jgi:hypothetical protein